MPSGAQTHMMTHTKREPRTMPRNPFFLAENKNILEISSVSVHVVRLSVSMLPIVQLGSSNFQQSASENEYMSMSI